jgi:hypothetical protein
MRVAVLDDNGDLRSAIWRVWSWKNDIYVAARSLASEIKTSIHSSGRARHAFVSPEKASHWRPPGVDRTLDKWRLQPITANCPIRLLLQIVIPEPDGPTDRMPEGREPLWRIQPPPSGWMTDGLERIRSGDFASPGDIHDR